MSFSKLTPDAFDYLSYQNKKPKVSNKNQTNASRGAKHVVRRSGATPGISKMII